MENKIRDLRSRHYFRVDDEYLNGYARELRTGATLVYLSLCRHANLDQQSWPGIGLLCEELNLSIQTVLNSIKELEKWNIIFVVREKDKDTKRQKTNIYQLIDKQFWKPKPSVPHTLGKEQSRFYHLEPEPVLNDTKKPVLATRVEGLHREQEGNTTLATQVGKTPPEGNPPAVKKDPRNPAIQSLWEFGISEGLSETKQNLQRYCLNRLLKKLTPEQLRKGIIFARQIKREAYAPQINNWLDYEDKLPKLRDWVHRWQNNPKKGKLWKP